MKQTIVKYIFKKEVSFREMCMTCERLDNIQRVAEKKVIDRVFPNYEESEKELHGLNIFDTDFEIQKIMIISGITGEVYAERDEFGLWEINV